MLTHPASGDSFCFAGAREVASGAVEASDAFSPLTAIGTGTASHIATAAISWNESGIGPPRLDSKSVKVQLLCLLSSCESSIVASDPDILQ